MIGTPVTNMPEKMKDTAALVIAPSALAILGGILSAGIPPMGEMGAAQ